MDKRNLLIASTSTVYGKPYLEYIRKEIIEFFNASKHILFIPYARPGGITFDQYTSIARKFFESNGLALKGIHEFDDPINAVTDCNGIFTGGGNTFVLLKTLYDQGLLPHLRSRINEGIPYMGTSAGSNILGPSIRTTNDMPIVYPPSFDAIGAVDFNINPHYVDPDPNSKHMGETRETRIREFLAFNNVYVVGLREGSFIRIKENKISLGGRHTMRIFEKGKDPLELGANDELTFLL